jgi:hypothetical protein
MRLMGLFTYAQMQKSSRERFILLARLSAISFYYVYQKHFLSSVDQKTMLLKPKQTIKSVVESGVVEKIRANSGT